MKKLNFVILFLILVLVIFSSLTVFGQTDDCWHSEIVVTPLEPELDSIVTFIKKISADGDCDKIEMKKFVEKAKVFDWSKKFDRYNTNLKNRIQESYKNYSKNFFFFSDRENEIWMTFSNISQKKINNISGYPKWTFYFGAIFLLLGIIVCTTILIIQIKNQKK